MSHDNYGFTSSTDNLDGKKWPSSSSTYNQNGYDPKKNRGNVFVLELEDKKKSVQEYEGDYDPYNHRVVEHPTTYSETLLHLLKGSLGTGILAMPRAFYNAGWLVGLISTVIIGLLCTYCMRLLIGSEYELCKRKKVPSMGYPQTMESALSQGPRIFRWFAKPSAHVTNLFLMIYQLGTCCVYVVFIASNLKTAMDSYVTPIDERWYMLMILLPLIFINWIRSLKFLAPLSTAANGITFVSFAIILYYIFSETPSFQDRAPIGKVQNFPFFFGTVLFALEAIGVIMPLENEMKSPRSFASPCGVLNVGMGTIIFLYTGMGFFGYIRYGDEIQPTITLNLTAGDLMAKLVQILLAASMFVTHSIQCYVAIDISWNEYIGPLLEKNPHRLFWEYFVRTMIVILTTLLAVAIPKLELFITLFGAFCLSALGLAFPAIIQLCTFWSVSSPTERVIMTAKNTSLVLFGLLGLCVGTYTSLRDIINSFFET